MTTPSTVESPVQSELGMHGDLAFPRLITLSIITRLIVDTAVQLFNPFLTIFAAGLGVSVVTLGRLLSLRSLTGLAAPLIGSMADRYGYRRVMRLALLLIVAGLLLLGSSWNLMSATLSMICMGFGLSGFVPTLHAYLSARLTYSVRARGLGMLEYSWALAGIVGLYTMGRIIALTNWRVPLFVLAGGLAVMWLLLGILPTARTGDQLPKLEDGELKQTHTLSERIRAFFDVGPNMRSAYSAIVASLLLFFAGMQLFIVHGAWLSREYGLGAVELGTVALILGCFDLLASVSVSLFTDRLGKLRSVILGTTGVLFGYSLLPFLNTGVISAVTGIALTRACFEFAIVSQIPLMSEQAPEHRGKFMSISAAFTLVGGTVANLTGPWLYQAQGVWSLSLSSIAAVSIALLLLLTQVRETGV